MRHTIKQAFLYITMASVVAAGCGDGFYSDDLGESHDSVHDTVSREFAITGASKVDENENARLPYAAAVRLGQCSGLKIGARRFLTAAHCAYFRQPKSELRVSNALDATVRLDMPVLTGQPSMGTPHVYAWH